MRCLAVVIVLASAPAGCTRVPKGATVLGEIVKASSFTFARVAFGTILLFGFIGIVLASSAYFLIRRLGGYRWDWPAAKWFRIAMLILMLVLVPVLLATLGFYEGLYRGGERVLTTGKLPVEVYPQVGHAGADIVAGAYFTLLSISDSGAPLSAVHVPYRDIQDFRSGLRKLDVQDLERRLERVDCDLLHRALTLTRDRIKEQYPSLQTGIGEVLLDWTVDGILRVSANAAVGGQARRSRIRNPVIAFLDGMHQETATSADPGKISHAELSAYLVKALLMRPLLEMMHPFVRANEAPLILLVLVVIGVPVVFFRMAQAVYAHKARRGGKPN